MKMLAEADLGVHWTLYDLVDRLYGSRLGATLDELQIKGIMDYLDEGQSAWRMPGRRQGMFRAWLQIAKRNRRLRLYGLDVGEVLGDADRPEAAIDLVMRRLEIPERRWMDYFRLELAKLYGWAGFVRWRSQAKDYYWQARNPADLVDFIAIRLVLSLPLLDEAGRRYRRDFRHPALVRLLVEHPHECLLRHELHAGAILPDYAHRVEVALDSGDAGRIKALCLEYEREKTAREAALRARRLKALCERAGIPGSDLARARTGALRQMIDAVHAFRDREGFIWTQALERTHVRWLLARLASHWRSLRPESAPAGVGNDARRTRAASPADSAPAPVSAPLSAPVSAPVSAPAPAQVQALFCIDVRSERLRRQLEQIGPYDTYGVAGFFGVPVNFIELGKGHEAALCPAIVTPKQVALEMPQQHVHQSHSLYHLATEVVHDLKQTVLAPFITVEAVGLLFGGDMLGKTLAPVAYHRWREGLDKDKRPTQLVIDTISRHDALDLIATLQDEMVIRAVDRHFGIKRESITTAMIGELRSIALGEVQGRSSLAHRFDIDANDEAVFLASLRVEYGLNADQTRLALEQVARIGYQLAQQTLLVGNTLKTIGLVRDFARMILVVGHGSDSRNNPYESALDCGACGGDRGLTNARIFAAMANRREVRERLAKQGLRIPPETWFIPALHNTTTDETELFDLDQLPPGRLTQVTRIQEDLAAVGRLCAQERCRELGEPGVSSPQAASRRARRNAADWTQVRPEWGLSKNASFIIASRALTRALDLDGRAFLHSYDHRVDATGELLIGILSGPLIVAQWINLNYYFSTVDNEVFGSGSKVYHNVTGRFGVMTGNVSDLRSGLPAQTVFRGERPYHQPMRLVTLIEAPLAFVEAALERVHKVRELVRNGWIRVLVLDPETETALLFEGGEWVAQPWTPRNRAAQPPAGTPAAAPADPPADPPGDLPGDPKAPRLRRRPRRTANADGPAHPAAATTPESPP